MFVNKAVSLARQQGIGLYNEIGVRMDWSDDDFEDEIGTEDYNAWQAIVDHFGDRVDTLKVIAASLPAGATIDDLRSLINSLFEDSDTGYAKPSFTLSTIHKAKGREWPTVYWYGRDRYQPSKFAKKGWQIEQEVNLMYVAATRAQETLIEVMAAGGKLGQGDLTSSTAVG